MFAACLRCLPAFAACLPMSVCGVALRSLLKGSGGVFLGTQRVSGKAVCFLNCRKQTVFCHDGKNSLGILEEP